jgi:hypothetical protein
VLRVPMPEEKRESLRNGETMKTLAKHATKTSSRLTVKRATPQSRRPALQRKNLLLNQEKIDRAREIFGVTSDTEAIDLALDAANDLALFRAELDTGFKNLLGKGGFTDHFSPQNNA